MQFETGQRAVLVHHLTLALDHVDHHGGLAVLVGGEFLGFGSRDRGVAGNHLFRNCAHGFDAEAERRHVQQQAIGAHCQGLCLKRRAQRHHCVGVDIGQRLADEQFRHSLAHQGHPGRAAHQHHAANVFGFETGVFEHMAADIGSAVHKRRD